MRMRALSAFVPALLLLTGCSRNAAPPPDASKEDPPSAQPAPPAEVRTAERRASDSSEGLPYAQVAAKKRPRQLPRTGSSTLPAGTLLKVRLTAPVATATAKTGDIVSGELAEPAVVNGRYALEAGTKVTGRVIAATTSGRMSRPAALEFEMTELYVGSSRVPITTSHFERTGKGHTARNAELIAGGAAVGALVGQLTGKNTESTLKGAAAGAAAGTGAAAATGELDFTLEPGELITFKLEAPARL